MKDVFQSLRGLLEYVATAGASAATVSLALTLRSIIANLIEVRGKLKRVREEHFTAALTSDDLSLLGGYIETAVGPITVAEYSRRRDVATRVDQVLERVRQFVGSEAEVPNRPSEAPELVMTAAVHSPVDTAVNEVEPEARWNALAKMRRDIERKLRELAQRRGFEKGFRASAGQLVRLAAKREWITPAVTELLLYAVDVANRGVHGHPVSADETNSALKAAELAMAAMRDRAAENGNA